MHGLHKFNVTEGSMKNGKYNKKRMPYGDPGAAPQGGMERKGAAEVVEMIKYVKKYDAPTTPYQRLPDSLHIADVAPS